MSSLNMVMLIGNLGQDPEIRHTQDNRKIVQLSLATSERWQSKVGEKQERTEWHRVVIFNEHLGGVAERFLVKGARCLIEGQIRTRKYQDARGEDRYTTEVVVPNFGGKLVLLGGPGGAADPSGSPDGHRETKPRTTPGGMGERDSAVHGRDIGAGAAAASALDDEIPF